MTRKFSIPAARAMKNVQLNSFESDFEFIVENEVHKCPAFFAEFISPAVGRCRVSNLTVNTFTVEVSGVCGLFSQVIELCRGFEVNIAETSFPGIVLILQALDSIDFAAPFLEVILNEDITEANVKARLRLKDQNCFDHEAEISYLASHFEECHEGILRELTIPELTTVLSHHSLRVKNEDLIYDFICSFLDLNEEYQSLLESVQFEFLSNNCFSKFIIWSQDHFDAITYNVWLKICHRLSICPQLRIQSNSNRHSTLPVNHSTDPSFDPTKQFSANDLLVERLPFLHGIVCSLKHEHGSRWNNFVKVSSSSIYQPPTVYNCEFATHVSPFNGFASQNFSNSWLEYEFLHTKVYPTHYAIRSWFPGCSSNQWPRKWKVEGWTETGEQIELDDCTNSARDLIEDHLVLIFPIHKPQFVRRIRLTQIDKNKCNGDCLIISCFEIFGEIVQDD
jgi:hypothetical protein